MDIILVGVIFTLHEVRQYTLIVPPGAAHVFPLVEVVATATRVDEKVNAP